MFHSAGGAGWNQCYAFRLLAALRPPARWGRPDHSYIAPYCQRSRSDAFLISNVRPSYPRRNSLLLLE
jgi:hypothetical protein